MEDTPTSIIGIIVAAVLMFLVPLVLLSDRNDDIAQLVAQNATASFVDEVLKNGVITNENYQRFLNRLNSSGKTYEVDIEVKILDKNASQKYTEESQEIGQNEYYSIYTSQIEDKLSNTDGGADKIVLKEDDIIFVTARNTSKTLSQSIKNIYYKIKGEDLHIIVATASGTIAVNGATT